MKWSPALIIIPRHQQKKIQYSRDKKKKKKDEMTPFWTQQIKDIHIHSHIDIILISIDQKHSYICCACFSRDVSCDFVCPYYFLYQHSCDFISMFPLLRFVCRICFNSPLEPHIFCVVASMPLNSRIPAAALCSLSSLSISRLTMHTFYSRQTKQCFVQKMNQMTCWTFREQCQGALYAVWHSITWPMRRRKWCTWAYSIESDNN